MTDYTCYIIDAEFAKATVTEGLTRENFDGSVLNHVLDGGRLGIWKRGATGATTYTEMHVVAFYAASNYRDVRANESVIAFWVTNYEWARYCCDCRCSSCADCQCCCESCDQCNNGNCACCCEHNTENLG